MRSTAALCLSATLLACVPWPAAAFEWTIPASFHYLQVKSAAEDHDFIGLHVPALWLGGPLGPFALHFAGGYAYQRERILGDNLNFISLQSDLDLELPIGPLVPYLGGSAMAWYPLDPKAYMQGIPLMAAPHVGLRFSLFELVTLDFNAFGYPGLQNVWNVTNSAGQPYTGSSFGAGGKVSLSL
jgi:hypothetical protein